ncbi:MAG TPA: hypothetical protein VF692_07210 [Pyrinomonadaceae bacterium]|jgi:hypothetical protein
MAEERMTFQQVLQQSKDYELAANEISRFHNNNFQTLTPAQHRNLDEKEADLRSISRRLLNDASQIVWDDLQPTLQAIRNATDKMRRIRLHLKNVQRTLTFATAAISLGTSILSGNPVAIGTASLAIVNTINKFRDEDDEEARAEDEAVG